MQVDPIQPTLKAPVSESLKLRCDELLSNVAFKFIFRRYSEDGQLMHANSSSSSALNGRVVQVDPIKPTLKVESARI